MSMIVKYNHAYFITDKDIHNYLSTIHTNYTDRTTQYVLSKKVEKEEKDKEGETSDRKKESKDGGKVLSIEWCY